MKKLIFIIALPLLVLPGLAQSRNCLRIMSIDELARTSTFIGRVKVYKVDKANYRGMFTQLAILRPVDVFEGDFTMKEINVLARSNVQCAEDNYIEKQEMLVFLAPEDSLFHTQNFQYGQFPIVNEVVKGWRDKANKPVDKLYTEVRQEIEGYINAAHTPQVESPAPVPAPPPQPLPSLSKPATGSQQQPQQQSPPPVKPPQSNGEPPQQPQPQQGEPIPPRA